MVMFFRRETGANVLQVIDEIKRVLAEMDQPGSVLRQFQNDRHQIRMRLVFDDSVYLNSAIGIVQRNMFMGGFLAIGVLLLFLRSTRPTLLISLSIPISVFGTFVVMFVLGRSVNVISLAGMTFAVGMVIDNSIVVLENIDRHLNKGKSPIRAAWDGTKEVWGAIFASTLTTVAVFAPVLTIQEETGQLFYDLAITISAAVLLSLLVAITVIPSASVYLLKRADATRSGITRLTKSMFGLAPLLNKLTHRFADTIYLLMVPSFAGVWLRVVIITVITTASILLSYFLMPPASYLPNGNRNLVVGHLTPPPGNSIWQTAFTGRRVQESLRPFWEATTAEEATQIREVRDMRTGELMERVPPIAESWVAMGAGSVRTFCVSAEPSNVRPLVALLGETVNSLPGTAGTANQASLFGRRSGNNVQIEVVGNDLNRLRESAWYFQQRLIELFSRAGVRSNPSNFMEGAPEVQLQIDQVRAKEYGLTLAQIGVLARAFVDGVYSGDFDFDGDNIDLTLIRDPDIQLSPQAFGDLPIAVRRPGQTGTDIVPISHLVNFVPAEASQQIRRFEQQRSIQLSVTPPDDMPLELAQMIVQEAFEQSQLSGGVTPDIRIVLAGSSDKLHQMRTAMLGEWRGFTWQTLLSLFTSRFFLSLLLSYLLMAALFENFRYPFVIMFSVPFAMTGGFLGLAFVRWIEPTQQLDTLTMLGFIILIGIVTNNSILLVHQSLNFMRGYGGSEDEPIAPMHYREAIREAVRTRVRPIFMTSISSIFGMMPLALMPGAGSELYRGLGGVVLGGLACSTIFTLILVPLLFSLVMDMQHAWKKKT